MGVGCQDIVVAVADLDHDAIVKSAAVSPEEVVPRAVDHDVSGADITARDLVVADEVVLQAAVKGIAIAGGNPRVVIGRPGDGVAGVGIEGRVAIEKERREGIRGSDDIREGNADARDIGGTSSAPARWASSA